MRKKKNLGRIALLILSICLCAALSGCQMLSALLADYFPTAAETVALEEVPPFAGEPYVVLEGGVPAFEEEDLTTNSFETYSPLDLLGRCGAAYANVGPDLMPTEERGAIGMVKPAGWHTVKYDCVDGKYLYNRCHLIGYQLTGENANEENLITGTRYLNVEGMLPFENQVADYVQTTGNHVLYRVTPIYEGAELVARGVQMEALSVEDGGEGVRFNVYVYNAQPGVTIDYMTGESWLSGEEEPDPEEPAEEESAPAPAPEPAPQEPEEPGAGEAVTGYVLNVSSMKFHAPDCDGVRTMAEKNKVLSGEDREVLLAQGYAPCGQCKP